MKSKIFSTTVFLNTASNPMDGGIVISFIIYHKKVLLLQVFVKVGILWGDRVMVVAKFGAAGVK